MTARAIEIAASVVAVVIAGYLLGGAVVSAAIHHTIGAHR